MLKQKVLSRLARIVGKENLTTSPEDLTCYSYDAVNKKFLPEAVVFPADTAQVSEILALANHEQFAVIPRGAGTGFTGGTLAVLGGVVMALTRLNKILEIDTENLTAVVEPGLVCGEFKKEVEKRGLFYPPDPASFAFSTIGGNVAECAGGPSAVKYGVTRDYVTGLEIVLPTGEIMNTGVKTMKGVVGYDLTRLIIGSEGTLAVITKIYLRLLPVPEASVTLLAFFASIEASARTVSSIIQSKTVPSKLELMDRDALICVENYQKLGVPEEAEALLLIELDGDPGAIDRQAQRVEQISREQGAIQVDRARSAKEAADLWEVRRAISPSLRQLNLSKINEDIVVPRSKIPELVHRIEAIKHKYQIKIVNFGHAGDGNLHVNVMYNEALPAEKEKAEKAVEEVFREVLDLGGTISGEHGIGITKAPFLPLELSGPEIALMKRIKHLFDPQDILNPGKIFPETRAAGL